MYPPKNKQQNVNKSNTMVKGLLLSLLFIAENTHRVERLKALGQRTGGHQSISQHLLPKPRLHQCRAMDLLVLFAFDGSSYSFLFFFSSKSHSGQDSTANCREGAVLQHW